MSYGLDNAPQMNIDRLHVSGATPLMSTLEALTLKQAKLGGEPVLSEDAVSSMIAVWKNIGIFLRGNSYLRRPAVRIWANPDSMETLDSDAVSIVGSRVNQLRASCAHLTSATKPPNKLDNWRVATNFESTESAMQVMVFNFGRKLQKQSSDLYAQFNKKLSSY